MSRDWGGDVRGSEKLYVRKLWVDFLRSHISPGILVNIHRQIEERFRKRVVLANVPLFRFSFRGNMRTFSFRGNIRTHPRSGFRSGGTSTKTTLLETTLLGSSEICICSVQDLGNTLLFGCSCSSEVLQK